SVWAGVVHSHLGGLPPAADLNAERNLAEVLIGAGLTGLARAAHDLADVGLAQSLADAVLRYGVGVTVDLSPVAARDELDLATLLFAETGARALVAVAPDRAGELTDLAARHGVPLARVGTTGGAELAV